MGNAESAEAGHPHEGGAGGEAGEGGDDDDYDPFEGIDTLGYRVLGVQPSSPASKAGLVSFLDFLVGANDRMLLGSGESLEEGQEYDDVDLPALLESNKNQPVEFLVWNIKSQQTRLVDLIPADDWGGAGLLGVTIRLDDYAGAEDRLIRVLEVEPQSPAAVAGLVPQRDFLLGTAHQTLDDPQTLAAILHQYTDRVVELYVYNCDSDLVRVVALMPTLSWGGQGLLGAEVGIGYLHRLPHTVRHTEGASVERKVRYVTSTGAGGGGAGGSGGSNKPSNAGGGGRGNNNKPTGAILEMEPQLEMEPEEHHEEHHDDSEADLSGDMSSVALTEAGDDHNDGAAVVAERHHQQQAQEGEANAPRQQQQQQKQEEVRPPKQQEEEGAKAPQSPPQEDQKERRPSASFLPPPPKMHYDTPPREVGGSGNNDGEDLR